FDAWAAVAPAHRLTVVAHVGGNALDDCRTWARRAEALGFAAISAFAPSYDKPRTMAALVEWCAAIADAAPGLPFYYYDIPSMTGVSFAVDRVLVEASTRVPTFAGVK